MTSSALTNYSLGIFYRSLEPKFLDCTAKQVVYDLSNFSVFALIPRNISFQ
jgi:hypothetical protein